MPATKILPRTISVVSWTIYVVLAAFVVACHSNKTFNKEDLKLCNLADGDTATILSWRWWANNSITEPYPKKQTRLFPQEKAFLLRLRTVSSNEKRENLHRGRKRRRRRRSHTSICWGFHCGKRRWRGEWVQEASSLDSVLRCTRCHGDALGVPQTSPTGTSPCSTVCMLCLWNCPAAWNSPLLLKSLPPSPAAAAALDLLLCSHQPYSRLLHLLPRLLLPLHSHPW